MTPVPAVSVVMPAFNAEATLDASVRSVLDQTWTDLELLIVDDASQDSTALRAAEAAQRDRRVRVLRLQTNGGVARARNAALEAARGARVAFLDSDDTWAPDKLEVQLQSMRGGCSFSYMAYRHVDASGRSIRAWIPPPLTTYQRALRGNPIGTLTVMLDASMLGSSRFPIRGHEDYALWLQLLRRSGPASRAGEAKPYASYRVGSGSLSGSKWRALRWQWAIYREQERLSLPESLRCMAAYAGRGLSKHLF